MQGSVPLPKRDLCGFQTTYRSLNGSRYNPRSCVEGRRRRERAAALERARAAQEHVFSVYGTPLESVRTFKYLGRILSYDNKDWPAVIGNIRKARAKWAMVRRVLTRDGATPRVSGFFYKAVVQSVLLYGSDTWTLTEAMFGQLEAFHHGVARQLTGTRARFCRATSEWSAPPIEGVLEQAGLLPIREYISRRQNTAIEYITTRPIYETALAARRRSGSSSRRKRWWHQVDTGDDD